MKIEKIKIDKVIEYANNSKEHPEWQIEQIKNSIKEFGFNDPIAIDENNIIIEGHGRYRALKELGYDEIEVIKLMHLNENQKRAYTIVHNKLTMNTDFDYELNALEVEGFDLDIIGFEKIELDDIMGEEIELLELEEEPEEKEILNKRTKLCCPYCQQIADKSKFKEVLDGKDT